VYVLTDKNKWALPVRVEKLGAHVEAFVETLPTVTALRLCQRFGSGPQCFINKLPVELLGPIESFIIEPARESALQTWEKPYRCWELKCDIIDDHFTYEEQHDLYHRRHGVCSTRLREEEECIAGNCSFSQDMDGEATADARARFLGPRLNWKDHHFENHELWLNMAESEMPTLIFNEHRKLLRNWLGVDI
jgi:hypothetical protein